MKGNSALSRTGLTNLQINKKSFRPNPSSNYKRPENTPYSTYQMTQHNEPIAVIGSGCRFPGEATSPSKLWELLHHPRDVLSKIDRFRADNFYNVDGHHHGASNVRESYLLSEDPRAFDAQFFSVQSGEADCIDPQQRLLLETIYESLESAGQTIEGLQGSQTAVEAVAPRRRERSSRAGVFRQPVERRGPSARAPRGLRASRPTRVITQ